MQCDITINFGAGRLVVLRTQFDDGDPQAAAQAHTWLEQQYRRLGCAPVRPSGKVVLTDRILALALAAGYERLRNQEDAGAADFAHNAATVLRKRRITVDVPALTVSY